MEAMGRLVNERSRTEPAGALCGCRSFIRPGEVLGPGPSAATCVTLLSLPAQGIDGIMIFVLRRLCRG
jgi:hypothetical protein